MKITITLEDIGNGNIKIKCDPPVHKLKKMAADKSKSPILAYAGLMLKKFYEVVPRKEMAIMQGDDQAFADGVDKQKGFRSKLLLPGQDF